MAAGLECFESLQLKITHLELCYLVNTSLDVFYLFINPIVILYVGSHNMFSLICFHVYGRDVDRVR